VQPSTVGELLPMAAADQLEGMSVGIAEVETLVVFSPMDAAFNGNTVLGESISHWSASAVWMAKAICIGPEPSCGGSTPPGVVVGFSEAFSLKSRRTWSFATCSARIRSSCWKMMGKPKSWRYHLSWPA
jgi:hypothetical protein